MGTSGSQDEIDGRRDPPLLGEATGLLCELETGLLCGLRIGPL